MPCCPREFVTPDIWEFIQIVECAKHGLPPIAGGYLDQTQAFVTAYRFAVAELERTEPVG